MIETNPQAPDDPQDEDEKQFQAQLQDLFKEMEESVPRHFGKTANSSSPTTPIKPNSAS